MTSLPPPPPPLTVTVVATPHPQDSPPSIQIDVTVTPQVQNTIRVMRVEESGSGTPVRTGDPATLVAGEWTGLDYEAPYGVPVTYRVTLDNGLVATSNAVTLEPAEQNWLIHPGIPSLSRPVRVSEFRDRVRSTATGVHMVLGRSTPVIITDGVRQAPTFPLTLYTVGLDEEAALLALLADSSPLLLQTHRPGYPRRDYYWISVGEVTQSEPGMYGEGTDLWTLPCTVVTAPTGLQQSPWTWRDVVDGYATWGDVLAAYPTWRDVVINAAV